MLDKSNPFSDNYEFTGTDKADFYGAPGTGWIQFYLCSCGQPLEAKCFPEHKAMGHTAEEFFRSLEDAVMRRIEGK
jgi:hypothetical protein